MSKKLMPIGDYSTGRSKPQVVIKTMKSPSISVKSDGTDKFYEDNLKDYESLMNYCMKLMEENKQLLIENSELRKENEESLTLNIELLEENSTLKKDKDKLVDDSLSVIEYNEQLVQNKDHSDAKYDSLKEKLRIVVTALKPEAVASLTQKDPEFLNGITK